MFVCVCMYVCVCVCVYTYISGMTVKEEAFLIKYEEKLTYIKNEILRNDMPSNVFVLHLLL